MQNNNSRLWKLLPAVACAIALAACSKSQTQHTYDIREDGPKIDPKNIDAKATTLRLADASYAKGDYDMAAQLYFRAAELQPDNGGVMVKLGFALFKAGGAADAEKIFRAALHTQPKNADALRGLAHSLVAQGRAAEALPVYRQALAASSPPDARIYAGLGAALDMVGKHAEARAAYEAGLKLAPNDFGIRNNLALSYAMSGDTTKAQGVVSSMGQDPAPATKVRQTLSALQTTVAQAAPRTAKPHRSVAERPAPQKQVAQRPTADEPGADRPATGRPVAGLAAEIGEVAEVPAQTAGSPRTRTVQKATADIPGADTIDGEIFITTGRATVVHASTPPAETRTAAMSFKTAADTPEEEAAEVLELLAQAERGPRFVWQMARRPDPS